MPAGNRSNLVSIASGWKTCKIRLLFFFFWICVIAVAAVECRTHLFEREMLTLSFGLVLLFINVNLVYDGIRTLARKVLLYLFPFIPKVLHYDFQVIYRSNKKGYCRHLPRQKITVKVQSHYRWGKLTFLNGKVQIGIDE